MLAKMILLKYYGVGIREQCKIDFIYKRVLRPLYKIIVEQKKTIKKMDRVPFCWPLETMKNKNVFIKLEGQREIKGILKSYDQVGNLVLAETVLVSPGAFKPSKFVPRNLGATVVRAPHIESINVEA